MLVKGAVSRNSQGLESKPHIIIFFRQTEIKSYFSLQEQRARLANRHKSFNKIQRLQIHEYSRIYRLYSGSSEIKENKRMREAGRQIIIESFCYRYLFMLVLRFRFYKSLFYLELYRSCKEKNESFIYVLTKLCHIRRPS